MKLISKEEAFIGLDIGSSMIKAVKISHKGKKRILDSYSFEPIEEGVVQSGEIRNPSSLAQSTLKAVRRCDPKVKNVVVSLPNHSILSEVLTMNLRPDKEMKEAVMMEAEQMSAFDLDDVEIDYEILERDETAKKVKVLMVVAKNDIIYSYVDLLSEAGLIPMALDVDLFALANIFHLNYDVNKCASCVLINIGTESTVAAFIRNGVYHSSRDIPIAGEVFLRELSTMNGIDKETVHEIMRGTIPKDVNVEELTTRLNIAGKEFSSAVSVALSYFHASDGASKTEMIILTGGYSWIPGLINMLEMRTGAEVIILDPFTNITYRENTMQGLDARKVGSTLSVAMGLATRKV